MRLFFNIRASALAIAVAWSSAAMAQTDPSDPSESTFAADIIVTAQKRDQNLQDIAGSVSAIGSEQLAITGSRSVPDLVAQLPGVTFGQVVGGTFVTVRGIGTAVDTGVAEPNVALHVDGVFLPRSSEATLDSGDLERVEILSGPQGTLYGRNATGGAINFISKAPTRELSGGFLLNLGNYETVSASANISGPLSDAVRVRVSAGRDYRGDGYVKNIFTGGTIDKLKRYSARAAIQADLSESAVLDMSVLYQKEKFDAYASLQQPIGPAGFFLFPQLRTAVTSTEPWRIGINFEDGSERDTLLARTGLTVDLTDRVQFKSITGYIRHNLNINYDADSSSASVVNLEDTASSSRSFSQEFNLTGSIPGTLDWVVGAFYFHENYKLANRVVFPSGSPLLGYPTGTLSLNALEDKNRSIAAFADATVSLSDTFRIYGGARVSEDKKTSHQTVGNIYPTGSPPLQCDALETVVKQTSFSPRIGAQFDLTDRIMTYGQYQKGFKSGGVNSTRCGNQFRPEVLDAFEVGIKSRIFDNRMTLNAAFFKYNYSDLQIYIYQPTGSFVDNADSRVWGAELSSELIVSDIFRLGASATLLDAKYTNLITSDPAQGGVIRDFSGNRMNRTPKYAVSIAPQFNFPVKFGGFDELVLRSDIKFSGDYYFRPANLPQDRQKPFQTINVSAALTATEGLTVRGYVRNLTNEAVKYHSAYNGLIGTWNGNLAPPRTYGIEIGYNF